MCNNLRDEGNGSDGSPTPPCVSYRRVGEHPGAGGHPHLQVHALIHQHLPPQPQAHTQPIQSINKQMASINLLKAFNQYPIVVFRSESLALKQI